MCHWVEEEEEEVSQNECKYISIAVSCNKVHKKRLSSSNSKSERIWEIANIVIFWLRTWVKSAMKRALSSEQL